MVLILRRRRSSNLCVCRLKNDNLELESRLENSKELINRQAFQIEKLESSRDASKDDKAQDTPLPPVQQVITVPALTISSPSTLSTQEPSVELQSLQSKFADLAVKMQETFDTTMSEAITAQDKISRAQESEDNFRKKITQLDEEISGNERARIQLEKSWSGAMNRERLMRNRLEQVEKNQEFDRSVNAVRVGKEKMVVMEKEEKLRAQVIRLEKEGLEREGKLRSLEEEVSTARAEDEISRSQLKSLRASSEAENRLRATTTSSVSDSEGQSSLSLLFLELIDSSTQMRVSLRASEQRRLSPRCTRCQS